MISFHVEITGLAETREKLNKVKDAITNTNDILNDVGTWFLAFLTNDVFETEGAVIDAPWTPLSIKTIAEKAMLWPGRGTLVRSGLLQSSWRLMTTSNYALLHIPDSEVPYAKYHDSDGPRTRLPQRKLVNMSDRLQNEIQNRIRQAVVDKIRRAVS